MIASIEIIPGERLILLADRPGGMLYEEEYDGSCDIDIEVDDINVTDTVTVVWAISET